MKTLTALTIILMLSAGYASAQSLNELSTASSQPTKTSDVTGFKAPAGPGITPQSTKSAPNPNVVLKPKLGGIFVEGPKYGTVMISPTAPASYGMGEKYLSAPSAGTDLRHESGYAAHRQTGGLKLFSLEF